MARADDEGVDVIDVLLDDMVAFLAKRNHRRTEIEELRRNAAGAIDVERDDPTGIDIVDLVMGMAKDAGRLKQRSNLSHGYLDERKVKTHREHLRATKRTLETLYRQEHHLAQQARYSNVHTYEWQRAKHARRRVERQYVNDLSSYFMATGQWTNREAGEFLWQFSRVDEEYERYGGSRFDLLAMHPAGL